MNTRAVVVAGLLLGVAPSALAQDDSEGGRWVTFKVTTTSAGPVAHQIDRTSIQNTWDFKTFWSRQWAVKARSPLTFTDVLWDRLAKGPIGFFTDEPVLWSQKFMVDCQGHRFGIRFVESNRPSEATAATPLSKMTWGNLDRFPAVLRTVCM